VLTAALLLGAGAFAGGHPGHIDSSKLVELAGGDDVVSLEIHLSGGLLKAVAKVDPDLYELVKNVYGIDAVILELPNAAAAEKARKAIRSTGQQLAAKGWERVARIRDGSEEVQVLVLNVDEKIDGLVVMVIDASDGGEVVFANIAGTIDLAAIQQIGEGFGIPGLEDLEELKDQ